MAGTGLEGLAAEPGQVPGAPLRRLAARDQPVGGVLADRLEQPVARRDAVLGHDQRAVNEPAQPVEGHEPRGAAATGPGLGRNLGRHGAGGVERPAAGEHGQAPEQALVRLGQEVPAPVDQALERLLPRQGGSPAPGEQPEPVVEALLDLGHGQHVHARRRAARSRAGCRRAGGRSPRPGRPWTRRGRSRGRSPRLGRRRGGPTPRTAIGVEVRDVRRPRLAGLGGGRQAERRDGHRRLAVDPERLAAGGQDPERSAVAQQPLGEPCAGVDHVLAVVDQQQEVLLAQEVDEALEHGAAGGVRDPDHPGDRLDDQPGVRERCQLHEPGAIGVALGLVAREVEHQPGLAGAPDADQGDHPLAFERSPDQPQLALATHERGQLRREVRPRRRGPERQRLVGEAGRDQLVDPLGPLDVAQAVLTPVHQRDARRQLAGHELVRRRRDEHLAAVPDREQPGDPVEGGPEVVPAARLDGAGVDGHPHAQRAGHGPLAGQERALPRQGGLDGPGRTREDGQHPIPRRLEDLAPGVLHHRAKQGVVAREGGGHGIAVPRPEPGAALDVTHQEGGGERCGTHGHQRYV